jgi:hypothetical protein
MYALEGGSVQIDERSALTYTEVENFLRYVVPRKLRNRGVLQALLGALMATGEARWEWHFTYQKRIFTSKSVTLEIRACSQGYDVTCVGADSEREWVLKRANREALRSPAHRNAKRTSSGTESQRKRTKLRERFKQAQLKKQQAAEKRRQQLEQKTFVRKQRREALPKNKERAFIRAAISREKNEDVTRIFRKSTISWHEATCAIVAIYGIASTDKCPARQIVNDHLKRSLKHNGGSFVMIKRNDFTFRFDLQVKFRGDFTPLRMSCTKDRHHPLYRAIREYFYERLIGLPIAKQQARRLRMFPTAIAA